MTMIIADIEKQIKYDRLTRDYNCLISIDGGAFESIGYAANYHEAEEKCNAYAYDYLSDNNAPEAAAELLMQDCDDIALLAEEIAAQERIPLAEAQAIAAELAPQLAQYATAWDGGCHAGLQ